MAKKTSLVSAAQSAISGEKLEIAVKGEGCGREAREKDLLHRPFCRQWFVEIWKDGSFRPSGVSDNLRSEGMLLLCGGKF